MSKDINVKINAAMKSFSDGMARAGAKVEELGLAFRAFHDFGVNYQDFKKSIQLENGHVITMPSEPKNFASARLDRLREEKQRELDPREVQLEKLKFENKPDIHAFLHPEVCEICGSTEKNKLDNCLKCWGE